MIAVLLPAGVIVADAHHDLRGKLTPVEEAATAGMRPARRAEFVTGRVLAHRALERMGLPPSLARAQTGEPRWPVGAVGSITHCDAYRAVAVADASHVAAVGIDAEPHAPLPHGVLDRIRASVDRLPASGGTVCVDRMLFCAKEAAFKAAAPTIGRPLSWRDITVDARADGTFEARVQTIRGAARMRGSWAVGGGLVAAAVTIPGERG